MSKAPESDISLDLRGSPGERAAQFMKVYCGSRRKRSPAHLHLTLRGGFVWTGAFDHAKEMYESSGYNGENYYYMLLT